MSTDRKEKTYPCPYKSKKRNEGSNTKHLTDIINKIKWDKRENEEDYSFGYFDNGLQTFGFKNIDFEESTKFALAVKKEHEITFIPFHKIRRVYKKGEVIWER